MTYTFKLSRRMARLRAPVLAVILLVLLLVGCSATDSFEPDSALPTGSEQVDTPALASASFAGGIPIGIWAQPTSLFGERYNGSLRNIWPEFLLGELAVIKARGGKVMLMFAGKEYHYRDGAGNFDLNKWKARVDRFRGIDFDSYVNDGTIIGHYLIDEPNDPANWNGKPIPGSVVDEMAKYSKQIWPEMLTVARAEPGYFNGRPQYLDAAWAQYVTRKGTAEDYLRENVAAAQERGLGLVVGLNILKGGPNGARMSASQVESFGSAMLGSTYPCAFISWVYDAGYLAPGSMQDAMDVLRAKAENRSTRSCRATSGGSTPPPPPPPSEEPPPPPPAGEAGSLPFGLFSAPMEEYSSRWTGTLYKATPGTIVQRLERAQSSGMRVIVMLAPTGQTKNPDGTFSLTKWKAQVDRFRSIQLGKHISSKVLYLHDLVDQPNCARCWGGRAIAWETVEEMARYSKSIWPALPTTTRAAPSMLATATFRWTYLDAGWAQYDTREGNLRTYLAAEVSAARQEGLGMVAGLNILDGSGGNTAPMTASQIKELGGILAAEPSACALVAWKYDESYLRQSGIREAFEAVARLARDRDAASCVVS